MPILTEPPSEEHPFAWVQGRVKKTLLSFGLILGLGIGTGLAKTLLSYSDRTETEPVAVTRADYERIQVGMSQVEVEAILNPGVEVSRSREQVRLVWENPDGSKIEARFEDGLLTHKEQAALR